MQFVGSFFANFKIYDCAWTHPDPEKDKFRDEILKSFGWKTIRYFERIPTVEELERDINSLL